MKKYAIIDFYRTNINGPIYIVATSDSLSQIGKRCKGHGEIVRCFQENGQSYFSRDLIDLRKDFKAR